MAFFNNQAHAGLALLIFAVLSIVAAVITLVFGFMEIEFEDTKYKMIDAVPAIGTLLAGFLYLGFAKRVRGGSAGGMLADKCGVSGGAFTDKFDIIVEFVHVFAFANIIEGIFYLPKDIPTGIVGIIIGLIILFVYMKITDGKETLFDKIIWVILIILFLFTIIEGLALLIGIITIPLAIAEIVIGVFMFMALLDGDVKKKFGM